MTEGRRERTEGCSPSRINSPMNSTPSSHLEAATLRTTQGRLTTTDGSVAGRLTEQYATAFGVVNRQSVKAVREELKKLERRRSRATNRFSTL